MNQFQMVLTINIQNSFYFYFYLNNNQDGKNCLHYSACKGHIQVTNLLIENGCNINARDKVIKFIHVAKSLRWSVNSLLMCLIKK